MFLTKLRSSTPYFCFLIDFVVLSFSDLTYVNLQFRPKLFIFKSILWSGSFRLDSLEHVQSHPIFFIFKSILWFFLSDLTYVNVHSCEEAYRVLRFGKSHLSVAPTELNHRSSRSHCVFSIKLVKVRGYQAKVFI